MAWAIQCKVYVIRCHAHDACSYRKVEVEGVLNEEIQLPQA